MRENVFFDWLLANEFSVVLVVVVVVAWVRSCVTIRSVFTPKVVQNNLHEDTVTYHEVHK